ncbi:MAG: SDR family NAD(P)-dependent oxidoreductase [Thermoleophilaceae bacterium]|nr:SDR family NAD(P)-dependent oxidoreductase [Thermoleophilaceae bacterium]
MPLDLSGRRALITGASGGIGGAIARALHGHGAHVLLNGRRADALAALAADLGERAKALPADLADPDGVRSLLARAGTVDVLVANAGLPASGTVDSFSEEQLDRALAVNLRAPMQMARALAPAMASRGHGHLVFVSSMAGKVASAGGAVYSATKFGLRGFAFALHEDLLDSGVGVTTVFPGFVSEAGMFAEAGVTLPRGVGTVTPDEVAAAVIRGLETNQPEIDVAPMLLRSGGWLFGVAPGLTAAFSRRAGGRGIAQRLAAAQGGKR